MLAFSHKRHNAWDGFQKMSSTSNYRVVFIRTLFDRVPPKMKLSRLASDDDWTLHLRFAMFQRVIEPELSCWEEVGAKMGGN